MGDISLFPREENPANPLPPLLASFLV